MVWFRLGTVAVVVVVVAAAAVVVAVVVGAVGTVRIAHKTPDGHT